MKGSVKVSGKGLDKDLQVIATNVRNMGVPTSQKYSKGISNARKYAAKDLHDLGYSHRQIMHALGLKSPQSVSKYLES